MKGAPGICTSMSHLHYGTGLRSGPRRERQLLRLVVHRRQQLDLVRRRGGARIPASAQHGEGGVGGKEVLLLARDVGLLDKVDVVALALRVDPHLSPRTNAMDESVSKAPGFGLRASMEEKQTKRTRQRTQSLPPRSAMKLRATASEKDVAR